ncbi:MAG: DUF1684 domain-containing protein [Propionibacteriaceae bacterium]|jgi:uncharacterized protein (DUF1684 family)|nr:DUF1684 domain-containing protein [Propionibacteriaceae bacterium]
MIDPQTDPQIKYEAFRARRNAAMLAPFAPAALVATQWVGDTAEPLEHVAGEWRMADGKVVAVGIEPSDVAELDAGVTWVDGDLVFEPESAAIWKGKQLLAIERYGTYGLRIFDPEAPGRTSLVGIDSYSYDPAWAVTARFKLVTPAEVEIDLVNGLKVPGTVSAVFTFESGDTTATMQIDAVPNEPAAVAFLDRMALEAGAPLRFLPIHWPEGDEWLRDGTGTAIVDFNYATLPPCAFSPHFMCPLPLAANRLPFAVTAGERAPLRN